MGPPRSALHDPLKGATPFDVVDRAPDRRLCRLDAGQTRLLGRSSRELCRLGRWLGRGRRSRCGLIFCRDGLLLFRRHRGQDLGADIGDGAGASSGSVAAGSAEVWSMSPSTLGDGREAGTMSTSMATACGSMSLPGPGSVISSGRSTARPMAWMTPAPIAKTGRLILSSLITAADSEGCWMHSLRLTRAS